MTNNKKTECTYINGKIFTANPDKPHATAMIVRDGKVAWMGSQADLEKIEGECVDLQGLSVLPGLIDAYLHPLYLANASKQIACTPPLIHIPLKI
jgi:predicted amidohydrolase YtcJ